MISLAYITFNEEKYIERSIVSAKKLADEIIIVDSFSIDKTVEICEKLGAKVFQEKWKHDFSYAKNFMISKCTQPWILSLDADEHLEGEKLEIINTALHIAPENEIVAWEFIRKNHYPIHESDSPYFGPPFYPDMQIRLFQKRPEIYYSGEVHEGLLQSIQAANIGYVGRIPVCIHHHLFRGDKEQFEIPKNQYYSDILKGVFHGS